jgi:hypothetical protein
MQVPLRQEGYNTSLSKYSNVEIETRISAFMLNTSRTDLNLAGVRLVTRDLQQLAAAPDLYSRLRELDVSGNDLGDDAAEAIAHLGSLQKLKLCETRVGDAGVKHLARIQPLRELDLNGIHFVERNSSDALQHLPFDCATVKSTRQRFSIARNREVSHRLKSLKLWPFRPQ